MFRHSGLYSKLVQAIGRGHWLPNSHSGASSHSDNTLTTNAGNEESRAHSKSAQRLESPTPYHSDSSYGDETLSPVSINDITCPSRNILADSQNVANSLDEDTLNDVESLKKGIIKTSKHKANAPITILLVGETGVGKSSVLELFANVLTGKDINNYDFHILDHTNERGGSDNQSQTNAPRLYELMSKNGKVVRILDTPGLADTRGIQQDELHIKSIATQIQEHINSVTAVLILANGTVPRVTVGTDYALSTLSSLFPKSLAHNVSFVFTNVSSPLHWNFSSDTIPSEFLGAPQFALNNPIALRREYLKLKNNPNTKKRRADLRNTVKASERNALQALVKLFDWLDSLEPLGTTKIPTVSQKREAMSTGPASIAINFAQSSFQNPFKQSWS